MTPDAVDRVIAEALALINGRRRRRRRPTRPRRRRREQRAKRKRTKRAQAPRPPTPMHRAAELDVEEAQRLARIAAAAPPASTFDGQLQRWRDRHEPDAQLEVVWNGARGRAGASLSSWK